MSLIISSCTTARPTYIIPAEEAESGDGLPTSTPFPARPVYAPGTLVDYTAQSGDTLPLLAVRFGTSPEEIRFVNPQIPESATTMPPGFPMKMPIYYRPLWGTAYQIIPDAAFVYGPDLLDFDLQAFVESSPGWLRYYNTYVQGVYMDASSTIKWISENYSLSPKLLLALMEYQAQVLSDPLRDENKERHLLRYDPQYRGVQLQLSLVADILSDAYYRFRQGELTEIEHLDGHVEAVDPWQNAATVALQSYFAQFMDGEDYLRAIGPDGYAATFQALFGDPWSRDTTVLPGSLLQPEFILPYEQGRAWAYTGGPHSAWGEQHPYAALDFAPPSDSSGCNATEQYALAVADGIIARTGIGIVVLDLDGDGDERTGWNVFYLHIAQEGRIAEGTVVKQGDPLGHPSCEGGQATGTHVHLARKFNGEWISAQSVIPFNLEGWTPIEGSRAYLGQLVRGDQVINASVKAVTSSWVTRE